MFQADLQTICQDIELQFNCITINFPLLMYTQFFFDVVTLLSLVNIIWEIFFSSISH